MSSQRLFLAPLVAILAGSACQEDLPQSPSDSSVPQADLLPADAKVSGKDLIAFLSDRDGGNPEIYVMRTNGKKQTRLTNDTNFDQMPAWSPDRSRIAFSSWPNGNPDADIYTMNADGSGRIRLTNDPSYEENPSWSPDGSKIAFDRNGEIIIMNADGSNQTAIPHAPNDNDFDPDWSPDGSKLAFSRERDLNQCEDIWVMNVDGSQQVNLTPDPTSCHDLQAAWSPDGSKIAFISNRTAGIYQIYVMGADGSNQTKLTSTGTSNSPTWSTDGSKIAFAGFRGGNSDVFVMNADGSGETQLTTDPAGDFNPAWAP